MHPKKCAPAWFQPKPGAHRASGAGGGANWTQQKCRQMRVVTRLAVGFALAARLGTADRRHMRRIGLLARTVTRLG
jgi:hypothetical protein